MLLSSREFTIIEVLFKKAPLSMSKLAQSVDISLRTLHSDIEMINFQLNNYGLDLFIEKNNNAYGWNIKSDKDYNFLKKHFSKKNEYQFPWSFENSRVPLIIRKLLITDEYIKSEVFQDNFNISDTTLTKDLNIVRKILNYYSLKLDYKPYYGMKVTGSEYTKLCAYTDLHDVYMLTDKHLFTVYAFNELGLDSIVFNSIANCISRFCIMKNYSLNDRALINLTVFSIAWFELNNLEYCEEDIKREMLDESSIINIFLSLSLDIDVSNSGDNYFVENLIKEIKNEIGIDLKDDPKIVNYICSLERRLEMISQKGHYKYGYESTEIKLMNYLNVSNSISFIIYSNLIKIHSQPFMLDVFAKLSLFLYNEFFTIPNSYSRLKILIVNSISKSINETFIYRSDLDLSEIDFINVYEHELRNIDYENYDALILLENSNINTEDIKIPIFNFEFFVKQKEYRRFWDKLLIKHQHKIFDPSTFNKYTEESKNNNNLQEYLQEQFKDLPMQKRIYKDYYKNWIKLQNIVIEEHQKKYIIIFSDFTEAKEVYIDGELFMVINICLNNNLLSVKQAETRIRPYII